MIVIDESVLSYLPRAGFTIAEEVRHLMLEFKLWKGVEIPEGANGHELSERTHFFVEKDAKTMAYALSMPRDDFRVAFRSSLRDPTASGVPESKVVGKTSTGVAEPFEVSPRAALYRARNLKLIDKNGQYVET